MKKRLLKEIPIIGGNTKCNFIEVQLTYNIGGMNYFTGNVEKRGFFLSVSPVEKRENSKVYVGFSGIKMCVKEVSKFSQKAFDNFEPTEEDIKKLVDHVVNKNGIII